MKHKITKTPLIRQRYNLETPTIHLTMHQKDKLNLTLIFNLKNKTQISKYSNTNNFNLKKPTSLLQTESRVPEAFRV